MSLRYIIPKDFYLAIFPLSGFMLGWLLDKKETERLTLFRDKSALYGRVLKDGEAPSWP